MTKLIHTREEVFEIRSHKSSIAFVPTMGALHEGHLSLIKLAKSLGDEIWVSIFVNPLQFSPGEDFDKYPRVLGRDLELLSEYSVDYVFAPSKEEIYDKAPYDLIKADPELSNTLCGLKRLGHFDGVCTVVKILFDILQPNYAIFGEKDYQQLQIIREMVKRLNLDVQIVSAPILREVSGLAMSSRNQYLNSEDREKASLIYQSLLKLNSVADFDLAQQKIWDELLDAGFEPEYISKKWGRIFIAAKLSGVRLIDNSEF